jgi:septum site-determining protein MinD
LQASNQGIAAIHLKDTDVSGAYSDLADRFLGEERPMRFIEPAKAGFFKRLFAGR